MKKYLIALIVVLSVISSFGRDVFVSDASGNDATARIDSIGKPFKTIDAALKVCGDSLNNQPIRIIIESGKYQMSQSNVIHNGFEMIGVKKITSDIVSKCTVANYKIWDSSGVVIESNGTYTQTGGVSATALAISTNSPNMGVTLVGLTFQNFILPTGLSFMYIRNPAALSFYSVTFQDLTVTNSEDGVITFKEGGAAKNLLENCKIIRLKQINTNTNFSFLLNVDRQYPLIFNSCTILDNSVTRSGVISGAIIVKRQGMDSIQFNNCTIENNSTSYLDYRFDYGEVTSFNNSIMKGNRFTNGITSKAFSATNSIFYRNTSLNLSSTGSNNVNINNSIFILDSINQYGDTLNGSVVFSNSIFNQFKISGSKNSFINSKLDTTQIFVSPETGDFRLNPWSQAVNIDGAGNNAGIYPTTPTATKAVITFPANITTRTTTLLKNESRIETIAFVVKGGPLEIDTSFCDIDSILVQGSKNGTLSKRLLPEKGTLAVGDTGKLIIEYTPITKSDTLNIRFGLSATNHGQTFTYIRNLNESVAWEDAIQINGKIPGKELIDFGTLVKPTNSKTMELVVSNVSGQPILIDSIMTTDSKFKFTPAAKNLTIPANGSDTLNLDFSPLQMAGTVNAQLKIYSKLYGSTPNSDQWVKGSYADAELVSSKASIVFGDIRKGEKVTTTFTITDTSSVALAISAITKASTDISIKQYGNPSDLSYPIAIAGKGNIEFEVCWIPQSAGALKDTLFIANNGAKPVIAIPLWGTSVEPAFSAKQTNFDLGNVPVLSTQDIALVLENKGSSGVRVDSIKSFDPSISIIPLANKDIASQGTATATIKVAVTNPQGGVLNGAHLLVYYDDKTVNGKSSFPVYVSAKFVAKPVVSFASISAKKLNWSETPITITAAAHDSDVVSGAPGINSYVWSPAVLVGTGATVVVKASDLKIGANEIRVSAIDNEGDTSTAAIDTIWIEGNAPFAKIDTIAPRSVILRDGAMVKLKLTAHDRDEPATNDAVKVQWYSTLKGILTGVTGKIDSIVPSTLELGLHGFYAIVTDDEGQITNSDTINIPVQNSMGHAIIVTGATFGETSYFMNNIAPNANMAYKRLKNRGFSDEQIFYMNPVSWQSIDGNGLTDSKIVDQTAMTKDNLHAYLTSIAGDIKKDIPLVIYFLGHGNANQQNAKFYISDNEYIDPATLNSWLNEFGDLSANKSYITIILDFCYSGGFVPGLTSTTQKRAVITSASAGTTAYFSRGKSFGTALFNEVYRGKSLKSCFETASLWSEQNAPGGAKAKPIMNIDLATADNIFLGGSQNLQSIIAEIDSVSSSITLGNVAMTAKCTGKVSSIRCRMVPESFDPKTGSYADLPVTTFTRSGEDTTLWSGIVTYFPAIGNYLLMVEGEDEGANMILPQGIAVKIDNTGIKTMNKPAQLFFGTANIGGSTQLKFGLPESSPVTITIYDLRGRVVNQLVNSVLNAGYYNIPLDNLMGAGMYITRFTAGSKSMTEKVMIQR